MKKAIYILLLIVAALSNTAKAQDSTLFPISDDSNGSKNVVAKNKAAQVNLRNKEIFRVRVIAHAGRC